MDTVIKVEGLYKKFCSSLKRSMFYGTTDMTRDMFGFSRNVKELRKSEFWALQDINFELKRGETLGLIGQNGCGKTTLLRLLNGIFPPNQGRITINGRIGALIAVGAGFHPHMTGRENIYINGSILGMSKNEIKQKFKKIVDFAEIGEFLDAPVATYSSGMSVRLGFAIAIHCEPDILLIDEILAVGDISFVGKCYNKIIDLQKSGTGIIIITHNTQSLLDFCQRGILLNYGVQLVDTTISDAIKKYEETLINEKIKKENIIENNKTYLKTRAYLENENSELITEVDTEKTTYFCCEIISELELENVYVTLHIQNIQGIVLVHIRNDIDKLGELKIKTGYNLIKICLKNLQLVGGVYKCSFTLSNNNVEKPILCNIHLQPALLIKGTKSSESIMKIEKEWILN